MSFIEGIGDDLLYVFGFLLFLGLISLAWLSTYVNLSATLFAMEQRRNEQEEEPITPIRSQSHDLSIEHESDTESSEIDEYLPEQSLILPEPILRQETTSTETEDQSLRITIKFLNETQKFISANANDTISKIKRLYFADELSTNKIIRFIYQGRELQDSETLRTYNIRDQTIIHCQITSQRHSTPNRINTTLPNNEFDTSSFLDLSPLNISPHFLLFSTVFLGSLWYLRLNYRVLFTPISTIILILITILFLIFTCGPLFPIGREIPSPIDLH